jgi:hypothetical protein
MISRFVNAARGYEKFWNALLGATMSTAAVTLVLWGVAVATVDAATGVGVFPPPSPEMIAGAIAAMVGGLFTALLVLLTGNSGTYSEEEMRNIVQQAQEDVRRAMEAEARPVPPAEPRAPSGMMSGGIMPLSETTPAQG